MTTVAWLQDRSDVVGGAELTAQALRESIPDGWAVGDDPDVWVVQNCVNYGPEIIEHFGDRPVVKVHHDVAPHMNPELRTWLLNHAHGVFCSPAQQDYMLKTYGAANGVCLPPAMDLMPFYEQRAKDQDRSGTVWIGNMVNHGKGLHLACDWAKRNGTVRFYGDGPFRPRGENVADWGPVAYDKVPRILGTAERLLFLPTALEPFGRVVAEAWAAGCKIITNKLCGAAWWLENHPDRVDTGAREFWAHVETVIA